MFLLISNVPPEAAEEISGTLIRERLAACVTETPVKSTYEWKGEIMQDSEVTLTLKVSAKALEQTRSRLVDLHPYEVPEILAISIDTGASHAPYVQWVNEMCIEGKSIPLEAD